MNPPATSDLFRALDETWPPKRFVDQPPWRLREGAGGGQRVSAATASGPITGHQVVEAEAGMRALNQHPLFMLKPGQEKMDQELELKCYDVVDPVAIYLAPTNDIATFCSTDIEAEWPPREATLCLWSDAGIGSGRIAVMKRVPGFKTALASKSGDDVLGAAFIAISGDIAMLHALEVSPVARKRGIGTKIMQAAANWALENGAFWLSLMVTRANVPANSLYRGLGMKEVGQYHYRRAAQAKQ